MSAEGTNEIYIFHFARWNWGRYHNQNLNFLFFFFFFFFLLYVLTSNMTSLKFDDVA